MFEKARRFLAEKREIIAYGVAGVLTIVINIGTFRALLFLNIDYRIANMTALLLTRIVNYTASKLFVFRTHCENIKQLLLEIMRFIFARSVTALIDFFGLLLAVAVFHLPVTICKYVLVVIITAINYVFAKNFVYKRVKSG